MAQPSLFYYLLKLLQINKYSRSVLTLTLVSEFNITCSHYKMCKHCLQALFRIQEKGGLKKSIDFDIRFDTSNYPHRQIHIKERKESICARAYIRLISFI